MGVEQTVNWSNPNDPSVTSHKLYYCLESEMLVHKVSPFVEIMMPTCEFDMSTINGLSNGNYKLALTAVNILGESNFSSEKILFLCLTVPAAPIWI